MKIIDSIFLAIALAFLLGTVTAIFIALNDAQTELIKERY